MTSRSPATGEQQSLSQSNSDPDEPLAGQRILVTRASAQAESLCALLRAQGAEPIELPVLAFAPPTDPAPLEAAARAVAHYDWLIFTSANGVDAFFARLDALRGDSGCPPGIEIAAIGRATAQRLRERGVEPTFVPEEFVAEAVLAGLVARGVAGKRLLLPRAEQARDVLPEGLRRAGATVEVVVAYRTVVPAPSAASRAALRRLEAGEIDVVTLASSSTARNLVALLDGRVDLLNRARIACIGPITAAAARDLGLRVDLVAAEYSMPGLVAALVASVSADTGRI